MLLLSASTFDFSVRSSSLGAGEDALDALFISFFPDISREGVEARTELITDISVEDLFVGVEGGVSALAT